MFKKNKNNKNKNLMFLVTFLFFISVIMLFLFFFSASNKYIYLGIGIFILFLSVAGFLFINKNEIKNEQQMTKYKTMYNDDLYSRAAEATETINKKEAERVRRILSNARNNTINPSNVNYLNKKKLSNKKKYKTELQV